MLSELLTRWLIIGGIVVGGVLLLAFILGLVFGRPGLLEGRLARGIKQAIRIFALCFAPLYLWMFFFPSGQAFAAALCREHLLLFYLLLFVPAFLYYGGRQD